MSLPSLAGVPQGFKFSTDTEILLPVADYLIAQGHATNLEWNKSEHDLQKFIALSIERMTRSTGIDKHTKDAPPLHVELKDHEGYYTVGDALKDTRLRLAIGSQECGYFEMGPATKKLERTRKGLGAALYSAVVSSLGEVGWIFDYGNAMQDRECMIEGLELEEGKEWDELSEKERSEYEIPDVDKAVPAHLKEVTLGGFTAERRDLLAEHKRIKSVSLALEMAELAAKLHTYGDEYPDGNSPCTYLVFFEQYDPITAAFDEWSQHFLEGDVTNLWQRTFHPAKPDELQKAFEAFELTTRLLAKAAELAPIVNGSKK